MPDLTTEGARVTLEIFVPFWGDPDLLWETVASVKAQRNPGWRMVVIDDCYPDESVPERFAAETDERITYVRNEVNLGITDNYRRAIAEATGEHLSILGCDDLLHPNYVDVVTGLIERHPRADVYQPGVQVIDETGAVVEPLADKVKQRLLTPRAETVLSGEGMATSLIKGNWLYWPSLTFRRETLARIDFRDDLPIIQDLALMMDIAFDGGSLAFSPELAFSYRRHSGSASQKTIVDGRRFRDDRVYYSMAARLSDEHGFTSTARAARARLFSRAHALSELPGLAAARSGPGLKAALTMAFGGDVRSPRA